MQSPTRELIKSTRLHAGLSQKEAANLIDKSRNTWTQWESEPNSPSHRKMDVAFWDLFLIRLGKKGLHKSQ